MPLAPSDQRFLKALDRLKAYLLIMAAAIFLLLLCTPASPMHLATAIIGITLCLLFWLTQRLLTFIAILDLELTKAINVLRRTVPEEVLEEVQREHLRRTN